MKHEHQETRNQTRDETIVSEHLSDLRGRVRWLTWASGLSWTVLVLFGSLLITGTLDWLIHFDDPGLRLVIGLAILGGSGFMLWRRLIAPLREPLPMGFLAGRIERRFPGLRGRVLSAVEFLQRKLDARVGSPELQQSVVGQALRDLEQIQPSDIVESKSIQRVMTASTILTLIVSTVAVLHPVEAATSVRRLMFPFANCPWPRQFELRLVRPDLTPVEIDLDRPLLMTRGESLELYVINERGRLPERVWFEHRTASEGEPVRETLRQTTLRDAKDKSREAATIQWTGTRGSLFFRATGGDDDTMPFVRVDVVQPPVVEALSVTITPPSYSGRPVETLPDGVGHAEGLIGTKIDIAGRSDKPLKSAVLRTGDKSPQPLTVAANGQGFTASFAITEPGTTAYWFELTDLGGFVDREAPRYDLRGIADAVPDVVIESPSGDIFLTADAELPIKVLAKDDLGLRDVRISWLLNEDPMVNIIPLHQVTREESNSGATPRLAESVTVLNLDHVWKLAELELQPGQKIVFRAEATDDYDLGPVPHVGRSTPRTITIVSKTDKQKELAGRVGDLLDDLQQAANLQKRARQLTSEVQTQLEETGELRPQDIDQLHRVDLDQRQAVSRLTHPNDGVESQASQLQEEFSANKLDDPETASRLERIVNEIRRLNRDQFPEIDRALTRATKEAESRSAASESNPKDPKAAPDKSGNSSSDPKNAKPTPGATDPNRASPQPDSDKQPNGAEKSGPSEKSSPTEKTDASSKESSETGNSNKTEGSDTAKPAPVKSADKSKPGSDTKSADTKPAEGTDPQSKPAKSGLDSSLAEAQSRQQQAEETLNELQELLSDWRDRRDVSRELSSLIEEQEKVQRESMDLGGQTSAKESAELGPQEKADLSKLAAKQRKLADQVDQLRKQLDKAADAVRDRDPDVAERFEKARDELANDGTSGKLQEAAADISENKIGAASQSQQQALKDLKDLDQQLKRDPADDVEQMMKQMEQVLSEFEELRKEQGDILDQTRQAAGQPDSPQKREQIEQLQLRQEELKTKLAEAERKLERLRMRRPSDAAARAQKRLAKAIQQLEEPDGADEAADQMEEALDEIEQAEMDLAVEQEIAKERLAQEQLEKLEDSLKGFAARQKTVIEETERIEGERMAKGSLSRGLLRSLRDLAETEKGLALEAEEMAKTLSVAEVFALVLKRAARSCQLAADRLTDKQTGSGTLALERDTLKKVENLLDVLKPDNKPPQKPEGNQEEPPQQDKDKEKGEQSGPPGESLPEIAQLKMLKLLQEEYLERTMLIDGLRDKDGNLPADAVAELDQLTREQSELADLTRDMIAKLQKNRPDPEDEEKPEGKSKEKSKEESDQKQSDEKKPPAE